MVHDEARNRLLLMVNSHQEESRSARGILPEDGGFRSLLEMGWPAREVKTGAEWSPELHLNRCPRPNMSLVRIVSLIRHRYWRMLFANQTRGPVTDCR